MIDKIKDFFSWITEKNINTASMLDEEAKGKYDDSEYKTLMSFLFENNLMHVVGEKIILYPERLKDVKEHSENIKISDFEKEKHIKLLKRFDLFKIITEVEYDKKIVGEVENRKSLFLIACGIFVKNHEISSFNICVNSESGAGKDYLVSNILAIFPKEVVESRTRITPTAFTYWHNSEFEPDWDWDGKICYLQDISNDILNSDVFKVMSSEGSCSTVVINQKAVDIIISGKPVIFVTAAGANPKNEMLRRFPIIMLNETREQTKLIMRRKAEYAKKGLNNSYNYDITKALSLLKRVSVKIPFADVVIEAYPDSHIIMRTHSGRLFDFIRASASLYQFQREVDDEGFIIAEPADYDIAIIALKQIMQNSLMIPLTKKQQKFLDLCREFKNGWFSASEIVGKCNFLSQQSVYLYLDRLQEYFFNVDSQERENSKRPVKVYKTIDIFNISIPTYEECIKLVNDRSVIINRNIRNVIINNNNSNNSINSTTNLPHEKQKEEIKSTDDKKSIVSLSSVKTSNKTPLNIQFDDKTIKTIKKEELNNNNCHYCQKPAKYSIKIIKTSDEMIKTEKGANNYEYVPVSVCLDCLKIHIKQIFKNLGNEVHVSEFKKYGISVDVINELLKDGFWIEPRPDILVLL